MVNSKKKREMGGSWKRSVSDDASVDDEVEEEVNKNKNEDEQGRWKLG